MRKENAGKAFSFDFSDNRSRAGTAILIKE
jgi:hypothetical protein